MILGNNFYVRVDRDQLNDVMYGPYSFKLACRKKAAFDELNISCEVYRLIIDEDGNEVT